jgi:HSP20 family protein
VDNVAVLRWDPWGDLVALQRDVNELFSRSYEPRAGGRAAARMIPPIDAFRTDEALVIRMELPGLSHDDVDIAVQDGVLTITGQRPMDADVAEDAWVRRERPVGAFERSFTLPKGTDAGRISASFDRGVLELAVPHPPEQQPRRITIDTGGEREDSSVAVGEGDAA